MSTKLTVVGKGSIVAPVGVPGWTYKLLNLRAQVMCAQAQVEALQVEDEDAANAVSRVLRGVKNQLEDLAAELESMGGPGA